MKINLASLHLSSDHIGGGWAGGFRRVVRWGTKCWAQWAGLANGQVDLQRKWNSKKSKKSVIQSPCSQILVIGKGVQRFVAEINLSIIPPVHYTVYYLNDSVWLRPVT